MNVLGIAFFFASTVARQDVMLRSGCETSDRDIATVAAGLPVEVRFSMTGSSGTCYKVSASVEGKTLSGYLPADAIRGIEEYDKARQSAPFITTPTAPAPSNPGKETAGPGFQFSGAAGHPLVEASMLLQKNQPAAALEIIEKSIRVSGRDYQHLVAAGIAAHRSDDTRRALDYLKEAHALHQDRSIEILIARLEKEAAGDKSAQKLFSNRFLLRYEAAVDPEAARTMVAVLEEEFSRVAGQLGCRTDERISTIIQSPQAYRSSTGAAEWSGGQYDGKIRIPYSETKVITSTLRQTLAHEIVHACLAHMGQYPAWLHEGLAQKLSGRGSEPQARNQFRAMAKAGRLPKLENMSQSWTRMSTQHAAAAYAYALSAVELLLEHYHAYGIQNVLRNPDRLPQITADLDRRLAE